MIGQKLKQLRESHNLSTEKVAEVLQMSARTYIKIEANERDIFISEAEKLATLYKVDKADLLFNEPRITFENKDNVKVGNQAYVQNIQGYEDAKQAYEKALQIQQETIEILKKELNRKK